MKVEIWSDVMCPFCYIGKRRFEAALQQFPEKDHIEITWKSFQLNPDLKTSGTQNLNEYLAAHKGWSVEYARQMNERVTDMAREAGLEYNLDKAVVANSRDAHRLLQLAKTVGKGDEMEEQLFRAYFTDGKNTADHATLLETAIAAGLDANEVQKVLDSDAFSSEVDHDIYEAHQIGVRGVPYFVFNDRYAVSGAQATETFLGALRQSFSEFAASSHSASNPETQASGVCTPGGDC
jgi:predicted DsbA family dithiol-disulfide isomerase